VALRAARFASPGRTAAARFASPVAPRRSIRFARSHRSRSLRFAGRTAPFDSFARQGDEARSAEEH